MGAQTGRRGLMRVSRSPEPMATGEGSRAVMALGP